MDLQKSKFNLINGQPDSPRRQKAINFLQNLGRRFGKTFQNDLIYNSEEDLRTSSTYTDAFSLNECCNNISTENNLNKTNNIHSSSCDISSLNSEIYNNNFNNNNTNSDTKLLSNKKGLHTVISVSSSVSRVLQNLSQFTNNHRSNSCTNTPLKQQKSNTTNKSNNNKLVTKSDRKTICTNNNSNKTKQQEPKRILRKPVNYVYLKGMSGLPTRRVPRSALCCNYLPR